MKKSSTVITKDDYLKAFTQFSGCTIEDLDGNYRMSDTEPCIKYNGETYLVSTYSDLLDRYRYFIENPSYSEIYTQTPIALWQHFIDQNEFLLNFTSDQIIVSLYNNWCSFWIDRFEKIEINNRPRLERSRENSYRDIQVLMQTVAIDPENILTNASNLQDDITLVPIVVMTIYELYNNDKAEGDNKEFLSECIKHLIDNGLELISDGDTFEKVTSVTASGMVDFYIYNPIYEMEDVD